METREQYTVVPAFDEELNKRLNGGADQVTPPDKSIGELKEEEREAIIKSLEDVESDPHTRIGVCWGLQDAIDIIKARGGP